VGLTLNLETPVERAFPYLDDIDDVMLMSIRPGWSGQELSPEVFPRIQAVRAEVDRRASNVDVEVDGGIKVENARRAVEAGATVLISASGIFRTPDPASAARAMAEIAREAA
jgi:ribulose-phosphate 3-epimerase